MESLITNVQDRKRSWSPGDVVLGSHLLIAGMHAEHFPSGFEGEVIDVGLAEAIDDEWKRAGVVSLREPGQSFIDRVFERVAEPFREGVADFRCQLCQGFRGRK